MADTTCYIQKLPSGLLERQNGVTEEHIPKPADDAADTEAMHAKQNLPQKLCATCSLPFTWRRKWAKDWGNVKYCSRRCRTGRNEYARRT